jgi:hypothetical protein
MTDLLAVRVSASSPLGRCARLCRWPALVTGIAVAWALTSWRLDAITTELGAVWLIREAFAIGAITAVFALDDPSRDLTESAVLARRWLVPFRLSVAASVVVFAALPPAILTGQLLRATTLWGLLLEATALLTLLAGCALTLQRRWNVDEPAQYTALGVMLLAMVDQLAAARWPLLVGPGPHWGNAHQRWGLLAAAAFGLCAWQLRDPASRPIRRPKR